MSASQLRKDTETLVHKALVRLRGPILERAIQIESHIDLYIASIYAETLDKEDEIICLILANMNMSTKLKIFGYLINFW